MSTFMLTDAYQRDDVSNILDLSQCFFFFFFFYIKVYAKYKKTKYKNFVN